MVPRNSKEIVEGQATKPYHRRAHHISQKTFSPPPTPTPFPDECDMEEFDTLNSSDETIAILGDRWWPQAAKQEGDKNSKKFLTQYMETTQ